MERFAVGDVVSFPFPYTDQSDIKIRPALVISIHGQDLMLCLITSQFVRDEYAIELTNNDFKYGSLNKFSYIRPNRIHTFHYTLIRSKIGALKKEKIKEVLDCIRGYI